MNENIIEKASKEFDEKHHGSVPLDEFIKNISEYENGVKDSVSYLLAAIEHFGTREVVEDGQERERYVFFDDPYGDGEHAVIGNTVVLNEFVEELRRRKTQEQESNKMIWFIGPTASGKSELKRCIINGIKGFAESEEGAKYTLEWSLDESGSSRMSYGEEFSSNREYYKSPVNSNPLSVFPENATKEVVSDSEIKPSSIIDLDPFSSEALDLLNEKYETFQEMVEDDCVRASRYYPEVGDGIGVLHTEDAGSPKQKLVGSWMNGAMEKFAKRGEKNPQAFSYDGVLSQGNGLVSIVEDAAHHSETIDKMMNACEEGMVKLDNKISMDIDNIIILFSNPDLEAELSEYVENRQYDPFRALRRRLDKYNFNYLTTLSMEAMLIRRSLTDEYSIWDAKDNRMEKAIQPVEIYGKELAPRVVEIAALYEIVTRLNIDGNEKISKVDIAEFLEKGEVEKNGEVISEGLPVFETIPSEDGIPVTYTVDKIIELAQDEDNDVILPIHAISKMKSDLDTNSIFSSDEVSEYRTEFYPVEEYLHKKQEADVLDAMIGDINVSEEEVRDYVDGIFAWEDGDENDYDAYELREFEIRYLGSVEEEYKDDAEAKQAVCNFRNNIIAPINNYIWENKSEGYTVDDVPLSESPALEPLLDENDWETVNRIYPDADLTQWNNPPSDTETEELKEKTIERMRELYNYSEESAEKVSAKIADSRAKLEERELKEI